MPLSSTTASESEFPSTLVLIQGMPSDAHALVAGDLGDASYRIDSYAESMDLMHRVVNSQQAATLVVLKANTGQAPDPLLVFSARVASANEDSQTLEIDLPLGTAQVAKGLTLRGSVKLQGVIVTFECETLGSRHGAGDPSAVLVARLPFRLYRLQRRDSFRVPLTNQSGVSITLKPGVRPLENIKALDVSCGGVSVLLRAPLEAVHQGKRFPRATVRLGVGSGSEQSYQADMLVRHVRLAPPGLNQLLAHKPPPAPPVQRPAAKYATKAGGSSGFRESAMAAVGALLQPELLQLGIEFESMPTALERHLAQLVNELGVRLMTRVKEDE